MKMIGLAAILALPLSGCGAVSQGLSAVGLAQEGATMAQGCSGVTVANYNAIKIGSTVSQVSSLLNCQPSEDLRADTSNAGEVVSYSYQGQNNRGIGITTSRGKVSSKSKVGM